MARDSYSQVVVVSLLILAVVAFSSSLSADPLLEAAGAAGLPAPASNLQSIATFELPSEAPVEEWDEDACRAGMTEVRQRLASIHQDMRQSSQKIEQARRVARRESPVVKPLAEEIDGLRAQLKAKEAELAKAIEGLPAVQEVILAQQELQREMEEMHRLHASIRDRFRVLRVEAARAQVEDTSEE